MALTCAGPSSTGAISTEGLEWTSVASAWVLGILIGVAGTQWCAAPGGPAPSGHGGAAAEVPEVEQLRRRRLKNLL